MAGPVPDNDDAAWAAATDPAQQAPAATGAAPVTSNNDDASWADAGAVNPSGSKVTGIAQGVSRGLVDNTGLVGGGLLGMKTGAAIGTLIEPGGGTIVGGAIGAGIGAWAGQKAATGVDNALNIPSADQQSPDVKPWAMGGEVFGGSLIPTGMFMGAAKMGVGPISGFVGKAIQYAKDNPLKFMLGEAGPAVSAGGGSAASQEYWPNNPWANIASTVTAGLASPTRWLTLGAQGAYVAARKATQMVSPAARETIAAGTLRKALSLNGDDPEATAALLNAAPADTTAAQGTGTNGLIALEQKLSEESASFGAQAKNTATAALSSVRNVVSNLRGTGDPGAVQAAAQIQGNYFRSLIFGRIQTAFNGALQSGRDLLGTASEGDLANVSTNAQQAVEGSLSDARKVEGGLYDDIGDLSQIRVTPTNMHDTAQNLQADHFINSSFGGPSMDPYMSTFSGLKEAGEEGAAEGEDALPAIQGDNPTAAAPIMGETASGNALESMAHDDVATAMGPETSDDGTRSLAEVRVFRSNMLDQARTAASMNLFGPARVYGQMAEAAQRDIEGAVVDDPIMQDKLNTARDFSRALHDTYDRTFAGAGTASTNTGAYRIPPEAFLGRAWGGGGTMGDLRLSQLEQSTKFLDTQGMGTPTSQANWQTMMDAQSQLLRTMAARTINPDTERLNPTALAVWVDRNSNILERFPEIRDQARAALTNANSARDIENMYTGGSRMQDQEDNFQRLLNENQIKLTPGKAAELGGADEGSAAAIKGATENDSPVDAIRKALAGPQPETDLQGFVDMIRQSRFNSPGTGGDAAAGLKAAILDHAANEATGTDGSLDFGKMDATLNAPMRPGLPSVTDVLRRNGMMSDLDFSNLQQILQTGKNVQKAMSPGTGIVPMQSTSPVVDFAERVAGSKLGGAAAKVVGLSNSLLAQSAGSKFIRSMSEKMDVASSRKVLQQAMLDPQYAAMLLSKYGTPAQGLQLARFVHSYALSAGLMNSGADNHDQQQPGPMPEATVPAGMELGGAVQP